MIDDTDHIEAIFLVARYGRKAPQIADDQCLEATDRGDRDAARRWRGIRRVIRRAITPMQPLKIRS